MDRDDALTAAIVAAVDADDALAEQLITVRRARRAARKAAAAKVATITQLASVKKP